MTVRLRAGHGGPVDVFFQLRCLFLTRGHGWLSIAHF